MSKFDKLLNASHHCQKICVSMNCEKSLKVMVIRCIHPKAAAVITHSESLAKCPLQFPSMNQLKKYTSKWSKK